MRKLSKVIEDEIEYLNSRENRTCPFCEHNTLLGSYCQDCVASFWRTTAACGFGCGDVRDGSVSTKEVIAVLKANLKLVKEIERENPQTLVN